MCTVVILDETKVNTGHLAYTNYGEVYSLITHTHTILDTLRRPMYLLSGTTGARILHVRRSRLIFSHTVATEVSILRTKECSALCVW